LKKIAIALLFSLICWLYPAKTLALKTDTPQTKTVEQTVGPSPQQVTSPNEPVGPIKSNKPLLPPAKKTVANPTPIATSTGYSGRHYSITEVQQLIRDYSAQYDISPEVPLCIARLESGFNQFSKNKSTTASGVFQYLTSTWHGTDEGKQGLSVFDAEANVRAAIKYMASRKSTSPWVVGPNCPTL
jgi:hypothetical protein